MNNQTTKKSKPAQRGASPRQVYLLAYNALCLVLWTIVTLRAIVLIPVLLSHDKLHNLYDALFTFLKFTQTIAVLEIIHAVVGVVRASPVTTFMQVASRLLVVWGVVELYPHIVSATNIFGRSEPGPNGAPIAFAGILLAWGSTEIVRYGFFVWKEGISDNIPYWLTWLRYSMFFVLYPIGISSECWLIYNALPSAAKAKNGYDLFLKGTLLLYVPGSYILYTHMMSQRRRVLRNKPKTK